MSFWALASRRVIPGTVQRSSTVAAAIGGTRQMSVAEKDNILPVSIKFVDYITAAVNEESTLYI